MSEAENTEQERQKESGAAEESVAGNGESRPKRRHKKPRPKEWEEADPRMSLGDTGHKGVSVVEDESPDVREIPTKGAPEASGEGGSLDVENTVRSFCSSFPGVSVRRVEPRSDRKFAVGVFVGEDPRPMAVVSVVSRRGRDEIVVSAYSFAGTKFMDGLARPLASEMGDSDVVPFSRSY